MIGMVIQIPMDTEDFEKIDKLGYGILTPSTEIVKYLGGAEKKQWCNNFSMWKHR